MSFTLAPGFLNYGLPGPWKRLCVIWVLRPGYQGWFLSTELVFSLYYKLYFYYFYYFLLLSYWVGPYGVMYARYHRAGVASIPSNHLVAALPHPDPQRSSHGWGSDEAAPVSTGVRDSRSGSAAVGTMVLHSPDIVQRSAASCRDPVAFRVPLVVRCWAADVPIVPPSLSECGWCGSISLSAPVAACRSGLLCPG